MFEFIFKGFDALQYQVGSLQTAADLPVLRWQHTLTRVLILHLQEHLDYEIIQSLNPEFNKAVVRVNIFKEHRQTIQVNETELLDLMSRDCS